mmetsp:Transcript_37108/g.73021  ORF Transcript_37108/g.73021 Transcript_37108/m.73021 type:complete len:211 (-) Transcript_37108:1452-2084(-)
MQEPPFDAPSDCRLDAALDFRPPPTAFLPRVPPQRFGAAPLDSPPMSPPFAFRGHLSHRLSGAPPVQRGGRQGDGTFWISSYPPHSQVLPVRPLCPSLSRIALVCLSDKTQEGGRQRWTPAGASRGRGRRSRETFSPPAETGKVSRKRGLCRVPPVRCGSSSSSLCRSTLPSPFLLVGSQMVLRAARQLQGPIPLAPPRCCPLPLPVHPH